MSVRLQRDPSIRLRKRLSANDVGDTRSHQAGIHIPLSVISFFPPLVEGDKNPDAWIEVEGLSGLEWHWRFVHYNNAIVAGGTRNEYRLTHTTSAMRALGASPGNDLEIERVGAVRYRVHLVKPHPEPRLLVLETIGPWRTVHARVL